MVNKKRTGQAGPAFTILIRKHIVFQYRQIIFSASSRLELEILNQIDIQMAYLDEFCGRDIKRNDGGKGVDSDIPS